jgi:hypothetical protein
MSEAVDVIKEIAVEAMSAEKPMQVVFGTVTATEPLEIQTEQKLILPQEVLTLADPVRDKTIIIHNGLKVGETVMLQRVQGGQLYIVADRVDSRLIEGEVESDV